jgi:hypothetical protein
MTIWRMCIACWVTKATDTHSEYVIFIAFPWQQWLHEHASMLCLCIHCLSCVYLVLVTASLRNVMIFIILYFKSQMIDKVQIIISYWVFASLVLKYSTILEGHTAIFNVNELVQIDAKYTEEESCRVRTLGSVFGQ